MLLGELSTWTAFWQHVLHVASYYLTVRVGASGRAVAHARDRGAAPTCEDDDDVAPPLATRLYTCCCSRHFRFAVPLSVARAVAGPSH